MSGFEWGLGPRESGNPFSTASLCGDITVSAVTSRTDVPVTGQRLVQLEPVAMETNMLSVGPPSLGSHDALRYDRIQ